LTDIRHFDRDQIVNAVQQFLMNPKYKTEGHVFLLFSLASSLQMIGFDEEKNSVYDLIASIFFDKKEIGSYELCELLDLKKDEMFYRFLKKNKCYIKII